LTIEFINLGADEYDRAKAVLNKARHPGFVGRELFYRCATTGVACVAVLDGVDSGVAMVAKGKLQALSVVASAQGNGLGSALMRRLQPEWVSSIVDRVPFFERLGYRSVGAPKVGQNGKHATQLLQLDEIPGGAAVAEMSSSAGPSAGPAAPAPLTRLSDLIEETAETRAIAQLQILDGLIERAILAERFDSALRILADANEHFAAIDRARSPEDSVPTAETAVRNRLRKLAY